MKLIDELVDSLSGESPKLTEALMKTKVLLYRLGRKDLVEWVTHELNGYPVDVQVPEYRIICSSVRGVVTNGFHRYSSYPLPTLHLKEETRNRFERLEMRESISALKGLAASDESKLVRPIAIEYNSIFEKSFSAGYHVERAWCDMGIGQIGQIVTVVRSRLLDFVLELESKVDDKMTEDEVKKIGQSPETGAMFQNAIFGDNATILVGNQNTQTVTNNVNQGDFNSLRELLEKNNIDHTSVEYLEQAIQADASSSDVIEKRFGLKVRNWMKEMIARAIDGSWQIEVGIASNLLTESLKSYYGW